MTEGMVLIRADEIDRALARIAHQLLEEGGEGDDLALVGIQTRGVPLARRLARKLAEMGAPEPPVGILDINLYRDDLSRVAAHPVVRRTEIPFPVEDRRIVLVDDVLYTGRTIRAALDALTDLGRPRLIRLAVLVDRGGREMPIQPDFVGRHFSAGPDQLIDVLLAEIDGGPDRVVLRPREPERTESAAAASASAVPADAVPAKGTAGGKTARKAAKKKAAKKKSAARKGTRTTGGKKAAKKKAAKKKSPAKKAARKKTKARTRRRGGGR